MVKLTEGLKYDGDKVRMDLLPGDALFAIADILTSGAKKYADRNWELGMNWSRPFGALMRHMWSWWQGKGPTNESFIFGVLDPETKRSHLWHAGCCIFFLIAYEMRKTGIDDRPLQTVADRVGTPPVRSGQTKNKKQILKVGESEVESLTRTT